MVQIVLLLKSTTSNCATINQMVQNHPLKAYPRAWPSSCNLGHRAGHHSVTAKLAHEYNIYCCKNLNPLTTDDLALSDFGRMLSVAQSVLKIGFALAKKVG